MTTAIRPSECQTAGIVNDWNSKAGAFCTVDFAWPRNTLFKEAAFYVCALHRPLLPGIALDRVSIYLDQYNIST